MMSAAIERLHRRLFTESAPETEVLVRTLLGALICWWSLSWLVDVNAILSEASLFPAEPGRRFTWTVFALGAPTWWVVAVLIITAAAGVSLITGRVARVGVVVAFVGLVSIQRLQPAANNAGDQLLRILVVWAIVSLVLGSRHTFTGSMVDPGPNRPRLFVASLRFQVVLIYWTSVAWKLQGSVWRDGEAVYAALHNPSVSSLPLPAFLSETSLGVAALTYLVLATEFAIPLLLLSGRWRTGIAISVALHIGFAVFLRVGIFTPAMIVAVAAFLPAAAVRSGWEALARRSSQSASAAA